MARVFLALLVCTPLLAADPAVEKLVEQLGHKAYAEREKAVKALRARGPVVLPELRAALTSPDEEIRTRATALVKELEIAAALEPKRITLKAESRPIPAILKDIESQTGYRVQMIGPAGAIEFECKDLPFWEAIDRLGKQTRLAPAVDSYSQSPELRLEPAGVHSPYVQITGPFRVEATKLHEDRDTLFRVAGPGRTNHQLTLTITVQAEPKLGLVSVGRPKVDKATDEAGRTYAIVEPPKTNMGTLPDYDSNVMSIGRRTEVRMRRADDKASRIAELSGTIPINVVIEKKKIVVSEKPLQAVGSTIRTGGAELVVTRADQQGGGQITIELKVPHEDGRGGSQWLNRLRLEDADGRAFDSYSSGSRSNGRERWVNKGFQPNGKVGPPAKLIFEDWVMLDHVIPFAFKDIALP